MSEGRGHRVGPATTTPPRDSGGDGQSALDVKTAQVQGLILSGSREKQNPRGVFRSGAGVLINRSNHESSRQSEMIIAAEPDLDLPQMEILYKWVHVPDCGY